MPKNIAKRIGRLALLATTLAAGVACADFKAGPIASLDQDVFGNRRFRALGPIVEVLRLENGATLRGVRPFWTEIEDPSDRYRDTDVLWPIFMAKHREREFEWWFCVLMNWVDADANEPKSKYRFWIIPVYFQGRNEKGENYLGVFPLGGRIDDILGNDKTYFILFPLYGYGRVGSYENYNVLWPIYARGRGKNRQRMRIFPFWGHARVRDDYTKTFIMWPFWTHARYKYAGSEGVAYIAFPFFGRVNLADQEAWWMLPPLFRFQTRGANRLTLCPWPIVQLQSGRIDKTYVWPLWGMKRAYGARSWFLFWPVVEHRTAERFNEEQRRFRIAPVLYTETLTSPPPGPDGPGEIVGRAFKVWPFFSYKRNRNLSKLRVLSLFPFRDFEQIDRNYSPLWTIYTRCRNGPAVEDELLWGLARWRRGGDQVEAGIFPLFNSSHDRVKDSSRFSVLMGLFARNREAKRIRYRVLYLITWTTGEQAENQTDQERN